MKILSLLGLTALAFLILVFVTSTFLAWLFDAPEGAELPPPDVSIEVLNGCGIDGAAKELTSILRKTGFNVYDFRNADHFNYDHTKILVRKGSIEEAETVAALIGCEDVVYEPSSDEYLADIAVVIGPDWEDLPVVTGRKETGDFKDAVLDLLDKFHYFKMINKFYERYCRADTAQDRKSSSESR